MAFEFPARLTADFWITLKRSPERWTAHCAGILDSQDAAAVVQPELLKFHQAVTDAKVPVVGLELHEVEYMNSSGLKSFMAWFLAAANSRESRYTIEVMFDPGRSWQQMSFRPMERLAPQTLKLVELPAQTATGA